VKHSLIFFKLPLKLFFIIILLILVQLARIVAAVTSGAVTSSPGTGEALAVAEIIGCVHSEFLLQFKILLAFVLEDDLHLLLEVSLLISECFLELLLSELSPLLYGELFFLMLLDQDLVVLLIPIALFLLELLRLGDLIILSFKLSLGVHDHSLLVIDDSQPPALHAVGPINDRGSVQQV